MIVLPCVCAMFYSNLQTLVAVNESSPEVGSSNNMTLGSVINSTPIAVLFRSPPEMVLCSTSPTSVFLHLSRPSLCINESILLSYSAIGILSFNLAAKVSASFTVKHEKITSSCIT